MYSNEEVQQFMCLALLGDGHLKWNYTSPTVIYAYIPSSKMFAVSNNGEWKLIGTFEFESISHDMQHATKIEIVKNGKTS